MAGSGGGKMLIFLLIGFFGICLAESNPNLLELANNQSNPIKTQPLPKKSSNQTLKNGIVHVFYRQLDFTATLDLMRISVELLDLEDFEKTGKAPVLEVTASNGRDNLLLKLPVFYPNLTLFEDGKLLEPLAQEDFGPRKKGKNKANTTLTQNLIITVQSRLHMDVRYKIQLKSLDRSQYNLIFKKDEDTKVLTNQHLTFVKPIGFFLNSQEQNVKEFHLTVTSEDDICGMLVTVPAEESLYDRRIDAHEIDNRRSMTFTRRADVFFSETEIQKFRNFRFFAFINPDDTACSSNFSRKSLNSQKKITFEFSRTTHGSSYFLPVSAMIFYFLLPGMLYFPILALKTLRNHQEALLANREEQEHQNRSLEGSPQRQRTESSEAPLNPTSSLEGSLDISDASEPREPVEIHIPTSDSLSLHGEMLRYPIAIILPVLMHTALEYHKFTTSSMANLDEMCFHNHACARPLGELRAFNNVISNLGYAMYGLLFVGVTFARRRRILEHKGSGTFECTLLDVTVGVFMVMQALASAAYHICPSDVAFQFDTPCIQVICGLLILRQWLVRLESPSAAYSNILLVAVVSLNFLMSALSTNTSVRYYIAVLHMLTISIFCLAKRVQLARSGVTSHKKAGNIFTASFLTLNVILMLLYTTTSLIHLNQISTYCFIANCILYLLYYTAMKVLHQEKISQVARVCGGLSVLFWISAALFFFQDDTDWTKTAAASRALNKPCLLLNFFGSHDLWHIFGASAGLFTFLYVSFVDDDLLNTPKHSVHLF